MPETGFIYKLCCRDPTIKDVDIGSTINLRVRKSQHKTNCYNENYHGYNYKVYQFIRANGGFQNFDIVQLEEANFDTKYELRARERYYLELLNATLNKYVPNRTDAESKRHYAIEHRDEINEKQRTKHNCVCGGKYTHCHRIQHFRSNKHLLYMANQQQLKLLATAEPICDNPA